MTEAVNIDPVRDFYDDLAGEYDLMTSFPKRFVHERPFFRMLVEKYGLHTALDAGTGTGFHALLLAQLGVAVTAIDVSPAMLREAKHHAREMNVNIEFVETPFQSLHATLQRQFDLVLSLGNSLAHLETGEDLRETLEQFFACTRPGGLLFLQNLNYERILAQRQRVQSVKENRDTTFVRFYDFEGNHVIFNILTIQRENGIVRQKTRSVRLRPVLCNELQDTLVAVGFSEIRTFGSIALSEFTPLESKDLVVLANRPSEKTENERLKKQKNP